MDARSTALTVMLIGLAVIVVGGLIYVGALSWFGRLPGDIRYSNGGTRIYFPITTMILVSIVISVVSYLVRRFL